MTLAAAAPFSVRGVRAFTGEAGVCLATSGPGAIHLLNGLYDAAMDHQPVVAIVGQAATTAIGGDYQQEVDLQNLFKDVAHNYVTTVMNVAAVRHAIVMARIKRRMIHFGEDEVPAERDDYVLHRASLEQMLAGSYEWD